MQSRFTLRLLLIAQLFLVGLGMGSLKAQVIPDDCPTSAPLSITVHQDPDVSIAGASVICVGGFDTLTATINQAGTGVCHIQWQSSSNGTTWADIPGADQPIYYTPALTDTTWYRVRYFCDAVAGASIDCNADTSNIQQIIVIPDATVDVGPANYVLCSGGTRTFTATVTNGTGNLTYQWQFSSSDSPYSWSNVGTNSNTYTTPTLTATSAPVTTYYRVLISQDGAGCNNTESAVITVTTYPDPLVDIGEPDTICTGGSSFLVATVLHGIGTCTIQWDSLDGATWVPIAGANNDTLLTGPLTRSRLYRARYFCDGFSCNEAISDTIQIVVTADPSVSIAGGELTICEGGSATLSAGVTGGAGTPSYQWESSTSNSPYAWAPISGATNQTLNVTGLTVTTYYRVRVIFSASGCDPVYSGVSTINVVPDPDVEITGTEPVCTDGSVTMTAVISGGTGTCTIQWQKFISGSPGTWQNIAGANGNTFTTPNLSITTIYRVQYSCTGGGCEVSYSEPDTVQVFQDPTIDVQPDGDIICQGGTLTMGVSASGGTPTLLYQWQFNTGTSGSPVWANVTNGTPAGATYTGANTDSLTVAGITNVGEYEYRVFVDATGSDCDSAFSNPAVIQVTQDPTVTTQPLGDTICVGGTHTMNVVATGGAFGLFYQWEYLNGGTWEPVTDLTPAGAIYTGGNTDNLTVADITEVGNHSYRVVITSPGSDCDTEVSDTVNLRVEPNLAIAVNPVGDSICVDGSHTMFATITGGSNLTYQWQIFSGGSWVNLTNGTPTGAVYTGITNDTLTVTGIDLSAVGFYQYQLVATSEGNSCGNITTDTAGLQVSPPLQITAEPVGDSICVGGQHTMTVTVTGGNTLSYQWQYNTGTYASPTWVNVSNGTPAGAAYTGGTTSSMTVNGITALGEHLYQVVTTSTGDNCTLITSDTARVFVSPALAVADEPDGAAICVDGTHTMTATITGGNFLTYQWQIFVTGAWQNVSNGTPAGATYTGINTNSLTGVGYDNPGNYEYRLLTTTGGNNCGQIYTDTALVTVVADPIVNAQPVGDTICVGGTTTLAVSASGGTPVLLYQWEFYDNGLWLDVSNNIPTGVTYSGANTNTLTLSGPTVAATYQYRVRLSATGNNCNTTWSNAVPVMVVPDPNITLNPVGDTICLGGQHLMTVVATGGTPGLNYQWQYNNSGTWGNVVNGTPAGTTYTGATNDSLLVSGTTVVGNHSFRVIVTASGSDCNPDTSTTAVITVNEEVSTTIVQADTIVCEEGTTTLTATLTGGTGALTYQWEYSENGGSTWAPVTGGSGATTLTLTTPELLVTTLFRLVITSTGSGCDPYVSNEYEVEVVPDPVIGISGVGDVCVGGGVLIQSNVTGGTGNCTIVWQISTNGGSTFSDIVPAATGPTYQTPALTTNTQYRARIICTGQGCCD